MNTRGVALLLAVFLFALPAVAVWAGDGKYDISVLSYEDGAKYIFIKYNIETGESWVQGEEGLQKIPEAGNVPFSLYKVQLVAVQDGFFASRLDMKSGRVWTITNAEWRELK